MQGSYWLSLYCNLKNNQIYYFDPYGDLPKVSICKLIMKIKIYFKMAQINLKYNDKKKYKNSIKLNYFNFIIRLLNGENFEDLFKL